MKNLKKMAAFFALSAMIFVTSCSNDDDNGTDDGPVENFELNGTQDGDRILDPSQEYKLTGTYTVTAGNKLTIPAGTVIVSETGTDKYIAVLKGAQIDVLGTETLPVIMRTANNAPGDWGGLVICGDATTTAGVDATAEVGSLIYGGSNNSDNSGNINYLIIQGAGAQINAESQYNGLTLYAVGSGTSINNVAMLNGADDGVEFFGGTVSVNNIYLENNEDDSVDWTEGWNGTVTNTYVLHTIDGFSTAVEADGDNGNPKFVNFTANSTAGGTALQFKAQSGGTFTGLSLTGYDVSIDMADGGPLANVIIDGEVGDPNNTYLNPPTVNVSIFDWVNSNQSGQQLVLLEGDVTGTVTLDPEVRYLLNNRMNVLSGAELIIPAGTNITARDGAEQVFIAVYQGGKIQVNGTSSNPVVMSSQSAQPGDWGGLVICGEASTTAGVDATAEVGNLIYGGTNDADDSGNISYLIIKGAGAQINSESQFNGLTLYSVGSETDINNVAMLNGADDGVEFFGGTVSASNIYLENNEDDSIDWTEGWNGTITNTYVLHTIEGFSTAIEADGDNGNPQIVNFTANSSTGGTALQFKVESGATFTGLSLTGYDTSIDMADGGPLENVIIEGMPGDPNNNYNNPETVDISLFNWVD